MMTWPVLTPPRRPRKSGPASPQAGPQAGGPVVVSGRIAYVLSLGLESSRPSLRPSLERRQSVVCVPSLQGVD